MSISDSSKSKSAANERLRTRDRKGLGQSKQTRNRAQYKLSDEVAGEESNSLFGTEYVYRCILTNDWDNSEKAIIEYYNKRGSSGRNFDCQNNDFGWAHLPFSFLKENNLFLIATAILKNFYLYFLDMLRGCVEGIDCSTRAKRFVRRFVTVPAKWTRSFCHYQTFMRD